MSDVTQISDKEVLIAKISEVINRMDMDPAVAKYFVSHPEEVFWAIETGFLNSSVLGRVYPPAPIIYAPLVPRSDRAS